MLWLYAKGQHGLPAKEAHGNWVELRLDTVTPRDHEKKGGINRVHHATPLNPALFILPCPLTVHVAQIWVSISYRRMTGAAGSKYGDCVSVRLCLRVRVNVCVGVGVGVCARHNAGMHGCQ